ncbi:MAG: phage portal protein [Rikenellaceae bacterium]|nr:phage portal protein [Rikenellaceae bacterium]
MTDALVSFKGIEDADGITENARAWVEQLSDEYFKHSGHNSMLKRYYDGKVSVSDYGVTADIPNDQTCHWPQKAVDALADRIRLESLTVPEGDQETLDAIVLRNDLVSNFNRHIACKLLYGCMAATVTRDTSGHACVRFHSAETFTALPSPDYTDGVVAGGLAIARREKTSWSDGQVVPTVVNLHTPFNVGEFRQVSEGEWTYEPGQVREALPTLYVFAHNGTGTLAPFGQTRITKFVRTLANDAIRCMWHMQVSGAFYSMAKLYMTGLTDEQFDAVMENKSKYQLSRLLALTTGADGENPNVGQLSGNSPQPFIDELRALACQFSGATGVPLNSLGIVQDNPSSAEAIQAAREDICLIAERDIEADKSTLRRVCQAAMAIEKNTTVDALDPADADIMASFASPMLNSLAARTDSALKIASVDQGFAGSDEFHKMVGMDEATRAAIKSEQRRAEALDAIAALNAAPVEVEQDAS